jgi:hypothetical protein
MKCEVCNYNDATNILEFEDGKISVCNECLEVYFVIKSHDRELMLVKQIIRLSEENCKLKNKLEGVKLNETMD